MERADHRRAFDNIVVRSVSSKPDRVLTLGSTVLLLRFLWGYFPAPTLAPVHDASNKRFAFLYTEASTLSIPRKKVFVCHLYYIRIASPAMGYLKLISTFWTHMLCDTSVLLPFFVPPRVRR